MKLVHVGTNQKLGPGVGAISRPVGPTCPASCPFLETACYAERLQDRYPSVAGSWAQSLGLTPEQWLEWADRLYRELVSASKRAKAIRVHVGGDWLRADGSIDLEYYVSFRIAVLRLRKAGVTIPMWYYTHAWRGFERLRDDLSKIGVRGYASVHGPEEAVEAIKAGWRLAIDPNEPVGPEIRSGFREIMGVRSLNCPEQVKGHAKVTCDDCGYCWRGGSHVTFYRH